MWRQRAELKRLAVKSLKLVRSLKCEFVKRVADKHKAWRKKSKAKLTALTALVWRALKRDANCLKWRGSMS